MTGDWQDLGSGTIVFTPFQHRFLHALAHAKHLGLKVTRFEVCHEDYGLMLADAQLTHSRDPRLTRCEFCGLPFDDVGDGRTQLIDAHGRTLRF